MFSNPAKGKAQGFTLIELVMTIVILGILSALAFPYFASLSEEAHDSAASGIFQKFRTSYQIGHTTWYARGQQNSVTLGDSTVAVSATGWPQANAGTVSGCQDFFADMLDFPPPTRNLFPLTPSPGDWGVLGFNFGGSPFCLYLYMSDTTPFRYFYHFPSQPDGGMVSFNL